MVTLSLGVGEIVGIVVGALVLLIIIFGIVILAWWIKTYNKLVKARNKVKNSWAQIDVQLRRRFDLLPNMVETIKGYATHEKEILEQFAQARKLYDSGAKEDSVAKMSEASNQLSKLVAFTIERYPELKADAQFSLLNGTLIDTENKIGFSRQFYNDVVLAYNNLREMFPSSIVAKAKNFKEEELFNVSEEIRDEAPKIKF